MQTNVIDTTRVSVSATEVTEEMKNTFQPIGVETNQASGRRAFSDNDVNEERWMKMNALLSSTKE